MCSAFTGIAGCPQAIRGAEERFVNSGDCLMPVAGFKAPCAPMHLFPRVLIAKRLMYRGSNRGIGQAARTLSSLAGSVKTI